MSYVSNRVDHGCPRCGSRSPWGDICGECEVAARVAAAFEAEIEELRATIAQLTMERAEPAPPDDPQAAEREAETRLDAMRATIARLTRERDAAAKVGEEDAAEFAQLRAEVSEAFGLPPTIRPAEGEIERFLQQITRDRDRLQRELREALERQEALRVERDDWQAETLQLREQVARANASPMLSREQTPSFYTLPEVAEVLKVPVSAVRRAVKAGELDVTRLGSLGIRVSQQALDRYRPRDGGREHPRSKPCPRTS